MASNSVPTMPKHIAYFSMEVGLNVTLPTYSGGLGILAGDTLKSMADAGLPVVAVTLLHRKGYFKQSLDADGKQTEAPVQWEPTERLRRMEQKVNVMIEGRNVEIAAWVHEIEGVRGHRLPVYFLDTASSKNHPSDQSLTDSLYGGDEHYRICQEVVLGMGGVKLLAALGLIPRHDEFQSVLHMNEGHAAFLTLGLLQHWGGADLRLAAHQHEARVKRSCVFTTHTPVPAGHDRFVRSLVAKVLGDATCEFLQEINTFEGDMMNMTHLAMHYSRFVNGVAKRHGEVSRQMFPNKSISAITNGIHAGTWTTDAFAKLFDKYLPGWRSDNHYFRYACEIPCEELRQTHQEAKRSLFSTIKERVGVEMDEKVLTIGFARRAAEYKRGDLLFQDVESLKALAKKCGGLQLVFAGKAHPRDMGGKKIIAKIHEAAKALTGSGIKFAFLPNYDMTLGRVICGGVDIWLNNPIKPLEASGTSGMKAALNGVPNLSTLDGWWVEGNVEGVTGWEIEDGQDGMNASANDETLRAQASKALLSKLGTAAEIYYGNEKKWSEIMRNSIFLNGSYFNTQRMVEQYVLQAYLN
jgi:starch phosphorylase